MTLALFQKKLFSSFCSCTSDGNLFWKVLGRVDVCIVTPVPPMKFARIGVQNVAFQKFTVLMQDADARQIFIAELLSVLSTVFLESLGFQAPPRYT